MIADQRSRDRTTELAWDASELEAACRTLASIPVTSISRIHVVVPCPGWLGGNVAVLRQARALARAFGCEAHGEPDTAQIAITFERTVSDVRSSPSSR